MNIQQTVLSIAVLALGAQGCGGGAASVPSTSVGAAAATSTPGAGAAGSAASENVSLTNLPLDDNHAISSPKVGYIYSCQTAFQGGGSSTVGPWVDQAANTFNLTEKFAVEGSVHWTSHFSDVVAGSSMRISGNGLPAQPSGTFPIARTDPAFAYDGNPNSILAQNVSFEVPAVPIVAKKPTCLNMGPVGIMFTGVQLYNALDGLGRDAVAHEMLDACDAHPDQSGTYHYHNMSSCIADPGTAHSNLIGYARDGFGIYGMRGENGGILTDANLDACHGHTHAIVWNGHNVVMYHYHMTREYPYSLGCYAGTPTVSSGPSGPP